MQIRARNQQAFSYLYDHYAGALNGVICRMVDEPRLAEDILQEAFVKIWNNFDYYDSSKGRLFTWMVSLTRNLTIDTLRSKSYKKAAKISGDENSVINYQDIVHTSDKMDAIGLRKQVAGLKPEHQHVIDLAYFGGYTQEEIAKEIGIPVGTVKTRMRAAISALRKIFDHK